MPILYLPTNGQVCGIGLGGAEGGGCLDGKSVHGGTVELGNVHIGIGVLGQDPSQALRQRHRFRVNCRKRRDVGEDPVDGVYVEKLFHDISISFCYAYPTGGP